MNIQHQNKCLLYRKRALKHYYDNINYYRNYYNENKLKLIEYSKSYKQKIKKDIERKKPIVNIYFGNFTVIF
jgi:hypothetical protein